MVGDDSMATRDVVAGSHAIRPRPAFRQRPGCARRREPGSREWKYQVEETSFLELLAKNFEDNAISLRESGADLRRIREHWGETLSEESKNTEKGKRTLHVLDLLIDWISIVERELDLFIQNLNLRFLDLEKEFTQPGRK